MSTIERLKNEIELAKMPAVPGSVFAIFKEKVITPKW